MAINPEDLQRRLCDQLGAGSRVERQADRELMLAAASGRPAIGDTLMRISCVHDIGAFLTGSHGLRIERNLGDQRGGQDRVVSCLDAPTDRLADALFWYGHALTGIYDFTLHSRRGLLPSSMKTSRTWSFRWQTTNGSGAITCCKTCQTRRPIRSTTDGRGRTVVRSSPMASPFGTRPASPRSSLITLGGFVSTSIRWWRSATRPRYHGWTWRGSRMREGIWPRRWASSGNLWPKLERRMA